jgi:hypothetical protein
VIFGVFGIDHYGTFKHQVLSKAIDGSYGLPDIRCQIMQLDIFHPFYDDTTKIGSRIDCYLRFLNTGFSGTTLRSVTISVRDKDGNTYDRLCGKHGYPPFNPNTVFEPKNGVVMIWSIVYIDDVPNDSLIPSTVMVTIVDAMDNVTVASRRVTE